MLSSVNSGRGGGITCSGLRARWCGPQGVTSFREMMEETHSVGTAALVDTWSQLTTLTTAAAVSFEPTNSVTRREPSWSLSDHYLRPREMVPLIQIPHERRGRAEPSSLASLPPSSSAPFSERCPSWTFLSFLPSITETPRSSGQELGSPQPFSVLSFPI